MPRFSAESPSRRHTPQTLSQANPQAWQSRGDPPKRGESSSSAPAESSDAPDDFADQTRASSSRTRWNARTSGSPYGSRPHTKHVSAEHRQLGETEMLVDLVLEHSSDDELEEPRNGAAASPEIGAEDGDSDDAADAPRDELDLELGAVDPSRDALPRPDSPLSGMAAKKREKNRKKRAKARAKAKEEAVTTAPDAIALPPHDLLASMSRIAKLIDSLNAGASENSPRALLRRVQETFTLDGHAVSPEQWRAEVLQSVRRMEGMLGQMEQWQTQVAPAEIEALRQETARLELRVRAVVDHQEPEESVGDVQTLQKKGKGKERAAAEVVVAEAEDSPQEEMVSRPGTPSAASDDTVSDSAPDSSFSPSDSDTGPTELDPEDRSPLEDKIVRVDLPTPVATPLSAPTTPPPIESIQPPLNPIEETRVPFASASPTSGAVGPSIAANNLNIPPEPPEEPVDYLAKHSWSMLEVLLLLEVAAHFPPAEHGWKFITEAYNNLLITRPLQEWFGKQAASSNEEEAKMKTLLQKMNAEARRLRARLTATSAPAKPSAATSASKAGERGKAAPFGSAEARAQATVHVRSATGKATTSTSSEPTVTTGAAKDAQIVTRLPFPLDDQSPASAPPPAQCIVSFPRRRPPFTLPSEDARQFTRIMRSAAAGVRPPSIDSRAAMLTLYSATKSRFSVRSAWDCWHRWCTPWVAQDKPTGTLNQSPVVLDYVAGNLAMPCGTGIAPTGEFEYHDIPGTYPGAPGVQHRVSTRYDPRPGMVSFARMTHLTAEKYWSDSGLGRVEGGNVTEEVLAGRRSRLPATLAGMWPGKAPPPPGRPAGGRPPPRAAWSHTPTSQTTSTVAAAAGIVGSHDAVKTDGPVVPDSRAPAGGSPVVPASNAVNLPDSVQVTPAPAPTATSPQTRPAATGTTTRPQPPFVALPQPRKPPARGSPRVPVGTLGSTERRGIRPWFDHAAVLPLALERLTDLRPRAAKFNEAFGTHLERPDGRTREQRGVWVPHHLRNLVVPLPSQADGMVSAAT